MEMIGFEHGALLEEPNTRFIPAVQGPRNLFHTNFSQSIPQIYSETEIKESGISNDLGKS